MYNNIGYLNSNSNNNIVSNDNNIVNDNNNVSNNTSENKVNRLKEALLIFASLLPALLLLGLLIWNLVEMNKHKKKICSLQKECITKPPQTVLSPDEALQTLESLKKDTVEGFLDSVDDISQQETDTDAVLLESLIKADIQRQKEEGIENPVINVDRLIEDAKSSFKNSDAIVALIRQKLQKSADDFELQEITTPTPFINCTDILQQKDEQIQNLQEKVNEFVPDRIITPTPFIDYKTILETRNLEIQNLKSDIQSLQERNKKIDEMLEERQKEILQKKTRIQEIKRSNMSKQNKIKQIRFLMKQKNKKIDEINELVSIRNRKISSLTDELKDTVPKVDFNRLKEITKEGNEEIEKALKEMLGLKKLTIMSNYGSSPIPNKSIFPKNLGKEEGIISTDKKRFLVHQSDGNIVSYDITKDLKNNKNGTYSGTVVWSSNTGPKKKHGRPYSFHWDTVKLKPDVLFLKGREGWINWKGQRKESSKYKRNKYKTKLSQNFDNNSIDITYETKYGSNWIKIL